MSLFLIFLFGRCNGKCYKNGRKFPCSQFVKEERKVASSMWDMFKL